MNRNAKNSSGKILNFGESAGVKVLTNVMFEETIMIYQGNQNEI